MSSQPPEKDTIQQMCESDPADTQAKLVNKNKDAAARILTNLSASLNGKSSGSYLFISEVSSVDLITRIERL